MPTTEELETRCQVAQHTINSFIALTEGLDNQLRLAQALSKAAITEDAQTKEFKQYLADFDLCLATIETLLPDARLVSAMMWEEPEPDPVPFLTLVKNE